MLFNDRNTPRPVSPRIPLNRFYPLIYDMEKELVIRNSMYQLALLKSTKKTEQE